MNNEVLFKNDLISIVWNNTRLDLLDSDGIYVDYFFDTEFEDEEDVDALADQYVSELQNLSEDRLCSWIERVFGIFKAEHYCGDEETMAALRKQWGDEWVVRIGNTALIIRE